MDSYEKLLQLGFQPFGTLTEQELEKVEERIRFKMPQDYRRFLMKSNGGSTPKDSYFCVKVPRVEESIDIDLFLGHKPKRSSSRLSKICDLGHWFDMFGYEYEGINTAQIVLSDPGVIVIGYENDPRDGVYLWDHTLELETSTEDDCMYKIADTFDEFISKIYVEKLETL